MINKIIKHNPKFIRPIFNHFTAGQDITSLTKKIQVLQSNNILPIVDYIKENVKNNEDIFKITNEYKELSNINNLEYIAIKLSSFNFDYDKIINTCDYIINKNKKILIDAEEVENQNKIDNLTNILIDKYNSKDINIYKTYQMYRIDSLFNLINDFNQFNNLGIKLVRGAYYNLDKNTNLLFNRKELTDMSFDRSLDFIFYNLSNKNTDKNNKEIIDLSFEKYLNVMSNNLSNLKNKNIDVFICTHNKNNIDKIIKLYDKNNLKHINIKHASLYGFINEETNKLKKSGIKIYKYLPYGNYEDSIPYLLRRIEENPKILKYLF